MVDAVLPTWKIWWLGARPRTLPAAVAPVVLGTAVAYPTFRWWVFLCALGVALFVQVATNYANDYSDGIRGTDDPESRSGPLRLVGSGVASPSSVKKAMLISFGLTALCGVPLVIFVDWRLIFVGIAAIAAGWFYTGGPSPYGYAGYGEVFVFVFFGLVATVGSFYVQATTVSVASVLCGLAAGSLATALLVVNNLRDIHSDALSGKRTLAVKIGEQSTRWLYTALMVIPFIMVPFVAGNTAKPFGALAFVAVIPARGPVTSVLSGSRGAELIDVLAKTGMVQMVFSLALAAGLILGSI